jgi:hypothetical protein
MKHKNKDKCQYCRKKEPLFCPKCVDEHCKRCADNSIQSERKRVCEIIENIGVELFCDAISMKQSVGDCIQELLAKINLEKVAKC